MVQSNRFASAFVWVGLAVGMWFVPATTQAAVPALPSDSSVLPESVLPEQVTDRAASSESTEGDRLAQFSPPTTVVANQRSLTVTGSGQSSVPADRAIVQLFYYPITPVEITTPSAIPAPVDVSELQFIVDALTEMDIPASDIAVYSDPNSYGGARVQVTMAQPTTDRIGQIITQTNQLVADDGQFSPSGTSVVYTIEQCAVPENQARQMAMADVQTRATDLATIAGVEVGEILSLSDYSSWNYAVSSCPTVESLSVSPFQYGGYPFDPTVPPTVSVTNQITATFAIED